MQRSLSDEWVCGVGRHRIKWQPAGVARTHCIARCSGRCTGSDVAAAAYARLPCLSRAFPVALVKRYLCIDSLSWLEFSLRLHAVFSADKFFSQQTTNASS
jgi:hypothetical protein